MALNTKIKNIGKLDDVTRELGQNNKDGWGYSIPASPRRPLPTRRLPRKK